MGYTLFELAGSEPEAPAARPAAEPAPGPAPEPARPAVAPPQGDPLPPRLAAALWRAIGTAPAAGSLREEFPILLPPAAVLRTAAGKRALWPALRRLRGSRARP
uniref:Uncharacterized protein n=1 Tax=Coralloluteibacterium stylophorae TaxID=1776034 RepID=A0A8J7VUL0_9GAMM